MKAAVYCGTRNVYEDMIPSIKSLLINSDVEKIYMTIEDDSFIFDLPEECEVINVSRQEWFPKNGCNYHTRWSYMILLRAAYTRMFPDLDRILVMDNDTIVKDDISELWDIDLDGYYFAAVKEPSRSKEIGDLYTCIGVSMFNLDLLRQTGMDERIIRELNNVRYLFPEQDVFNKLCNGYIKELPPEYGMSPWTTQCENPKIEHFAASGGMWKHYDIVHHYMNIPWKEIRKEKRMEGNEKEVRFDIYCKKCKYEKLQENEDPCWDCLVETVNVNSKKPVYFKEAKNEDTNSSTDV